MTRLRLFAGIAASVALGGVAFAQTSGYGATGQVASPTGSGAMQSPSSAAQPYAPPPVTGGTAQPSASGSMTGGMGGAMAPATGAPVLRAVPGANIIATLQASGQFTKLLAALQATNLTGLISTHPNLTLFAPTDAAFAQLPPGQLDQLMKAPAQLQAILTYHLVATTLNEGDIRGHAAGKVPAADNKQLTIDGSGPTIKVDEVSVLQPGVVASNGVIYPIGQVLTPPAA